MTTDDATPADGQVRAAGWVLALLTMTNLAMVLVHGSASMPWWLLVVCVGPLLLIAYLNVFRLRSTAGRGSRRSRVSLLAVYAVLTVLPTLAVPSWLVTWPVLGGAALALLRLWHGALFMGVLTLAAALATHDTLVHSWALTVFVAGGSVTFFALISLGLLAEELVGSRRQRVTMTLQEERLRFEEQLGRAIGDSLRDLSVASAEVLRGGTRGADASLVALQQRCQRLVTDVRRLSHALPDEQDIAVVGLRPNTLWLPVTRVSTAAAVLAAIAGLRLLDLMIGPQASGTPSAAHTHVGIHSVTVAVTAVCLVLLVAWWDHRGPRQWSILAVATVAAVVYAAVTPVGVPQLMGFASGITLLVLRHPYGLMVAAGELLTVGIFAADPASVAGSVFPLEWAVNTAAIVWALSTQYFTVRELDQSNSELARAAAVSQRLRLARDLHDRLGPIVTSISLKLHLAQRLWSTDAQRARGELSDAQDIAERADRELRSVVEGSMSMTTFEKELGWATEMLKGAGVRLVREVSTPVPTTSAYVLLPVLREGLHNVLRHSAATTCVVHVESTDANVTMSVRNDGVGDDPEHPSPGIGLANIQARMTSLGGAMDVQKWPPWFTLTVSIPSAAPALMTDDTKPRRSGAHA